MTDALNRLDAMKRNPRDDWTTRELVELCGAFGLDCEVPGGGRHYVLFHPSIDGLLTFPSRRPPRPIHVLLLVGMIETVLDKKQ